MTPPSLSASLALRSWLGQQWQVGRRLVEAVLGLNAARECALVTAPCTCGATSGDIPSPCSFQPAPARADVPTPSSGWVGRRHGSQGLGMRRVELLRDSRGVGCVDTPQGAPCHRKAMQPTATRARGSRLYTRDGLGHDTLRCVEWGYAGAPKHSQGTHSFTMPSTPLWIPAHRKGDASVRCY